MKVIKCLRTSFPRPPPCGGAAPHRGLPAGPPSPPRRASLSFRRRRRGHRRLSLRAAAAAAAIFLGRRSDLGGGDPLRPIQGRWRRPVATRVVVLAAATKRSRRRLGCPIWIPFGSGWWFLEPSCASFVPARQAASGLGTRHEDVGGSGPGRGGGGHLLRRRWSARWLWILASSPGVQWGDGAAGENRAMTRVMAGDGGVFASLSC